jgi:hypothetical protein
VVEYLPSKGKALSSNPSPPKIVGKKAKKKRRGNNLFARHLQCDGRYNYINC